MSTTILRPPPVVVSGWGNDDAWLAARAQGISASDVAACLGFSPYATPWEVWADKTGMRPRQVDADKECIRLGIALEPWLIIQARHHLGVPVVHTDARLYAHHDARWQLASPDAEARPEDGEPFGVEAKTAGLAGGFGVPKDWSDDEFPLGYQLQAHWQMRVMGWRKVLIVALVAGLGLRFYEVRRDLQVELDLVEQVTEWRQRHLTGGIEPPLCDRDANLLADVWPEPSEGHLRLDGNTPFVENVLDYQAGIDEERNGRRRKETAAANLERILGPHYAGTIDGNEIVTWKTRRGSVSWKSTAAAIHEASGGTPTDLAAIAEAHRGKPTRTIKVKGIK